VIDLATLCWQGLLVLDDGTAQNRHVDVILRKAVQLPASSSNSGPQSRTPSSSFICTLVR
jgi:hypothetical protein